MNFKSLKNKTKGDGKYVFAQPTMVFRNKEQITSGLRLHIVREDEVTRPDLIALEYYGDQTKTDLILKWNGVSDPFGLQPGDELIIPPSGVAFTKLERPTTTEENKIKNQFLQSKRFTKKDQRRLDALKKKYNKDVLLPPNVIPLGQKNYKFDKNGNIIFGAQAQNGEVNASSNPNGGFSSGAGNGSGGNDAVVDAIFNDLGQDARNAVLAAQGTGGSGAGNGSGNGNGNGNGNGSGNGKGDLTANQLENNLNNGVGRGGVTNSSGTGAGNGSGSGNGNGSGSGSGNNATSTGTNSNSSTSPQGSNNADGIANDGAPCN
jgi:hypothetical protein